MLVFCGVKMYEKCGEDSNELSEIKQNELTIRPSPMNPKDFKAEDELEKCRPAAGLKAEINGFERSCIGCELDLNSFEYVKY